MLLGDGCVVRVGVRARGASVRYVARDRFLGARTTVGACRCGAVRSRPSAVRSRRAVHCSVPRCAESIHSVLPYVLHSKVLPLSTFAKVEFTLQIHDSRNIYWYRVLCHKKSVNWRFVTFDL